MQQLKEEQLKNVKHDFIRYANCWEDAEILLKGLQLQNGKRILSIGSAGDNSFSLLTTQPEDIVVCDVNQPQLFLIELKMIAITHLSHSEYVSFIGFQETENRLYTYNEISGYLSVLCKTYWDNNLKLIESGIIHHGKFENYFRLFRKYVLSLIHNKKTINRLFEPKSKIDQKLFFKKEWENIRWKLLFKLFFGKFFMGHFGRDPEFLKQVEVEVGSNILDLTDQHFSEPLVQQNHYLNYIAKGNFNLGLPHYAREENYYFIKANLEKLTIYKGLADDACKDYRSFDAFNLSDIFEYMDVATFKNVSEVFVNHAGKNARYVYWNLLVKRNIADLFPDKIIYHKELSESLAKEDKCFFYNHVIVNERK